MILREIKSEILFGCKIIEFWENDIIIGWITVEKTNERTNLWDFYIKEKFRNQGFGKKAFKELVKNLKNNKLWLFVDKDNLGAQKIYKSCGFTISKDLGNIFHMTYN